MNLMRDLFGEATAEVAPQIAEKHGRREDHNARISLIARKAFETVRKIDREFVFSLLMRIGAGIHRGVARMNIGAGRRAAMAVMMRGRGRQRIKAARQFMNACAAILGRECARPRSVGNDDERGFVVSHEFLKRVKAGRGGS